MRSILFVVATTWAVSAQALAQTAGSMKGKETIAVGQGVTVIEIIRKNGTLRDICDFNFEFNRGDGAQRNIVSVKVTSTQDNGPVGPDASDGCGDWDVDDDEDKTEQEAGERDDGDSSAGQKTRVDRSGNGRDGNPGNPEPAPQNNAGQCIRKDSEFTITVTLSGATTGAGTLSVQPTGTVEQALCSAAFPDDRINGATLCTIENGPMFPPPSMGFGTNNGLTQPIGALQIERLDGGPLGNVFEVNGFGEGVLNTLNCGGGAACTLLLTSPVPPGGRLAVDIELISLSLTGTTEVLVTPIPLTNPVPALGPVGIVLAGGSVAGAGWWMLRRRAKAASA